MQFKSTSLVEAPESYDCLVFAVFGNKPGQSVSNVNKNLASELNLLLVKSNLGAQSSGYEIFITAAVKNKPLIVLVQFDRIQTITFKKIQKQLSDVIRELNNIGKKSLLLCWSELRGQGISLNQYYQLLAQYCEMTEYRDHTVNDHEAEQKTLETLVFFEPKLKHKKSLNQHIKIGKVIAQGINLSKSMSNLPANICTPTFLANQIVELTRDTVIQTTVFDEPKMEEFNMNCILAVSRGSNQQAKMIVMNYRGTEADCPPVILIGKGVTFDSGGYSIKSATGMHEMKFDMCGAASVVGAMHAISLLKLPINVISILPCSENLINGRAFKPGDILTSMSGQTVEILSTDAEGRLLLADALTYSQEFNPALIIDVATLTGAAITALGFDISAMMSNDKKLSNQLFKAGEMCHDYVWPLPIWEDYSEVLNSNFADMASSAGRDGNSGAGAIVAACFLSRFTNECRWAHLDVAGPAWHRGKHQTASGRPVALLSQFLINYSKKPF